MTSNGMKALGIEKIANKSINDIEKEIDSAENYNFLYETNVENLDFSVN